MTKACEEIVNVLIETGIEYVFGMPGGGTIPIWNALYGRQNKIKPILARHEGAASCMADMYGRLTGKPGTLMGQGAYIASSGGFGTMEAFLSNSPMLILVDTSDGGRFMQHGYNQSGSGEYGSFDIRDILRAMCKFVAYAATPEEAVQGTQLAIKHAITGRPGPAAVVMRNDAIKGELNPGRVPKIYPISGYLKETTVLPPADDIEKASRLLGSAKRPVIIAGNGVHLSKSYEEIKDLAELLGIPVATTYTGKSAFPEIHPLALGMIGRYGQRTANRVVSEADVILACGTGLAPSDTRGESLIDPVKQKLVQIDIDPRNVGWVFPVEMGLTGELKTTLKMILEASKKRQAGKDARIQERTAALKKIKSEERFFETPELHSNATPVLPERIVNAIQEAVTPDTILTLDAGNNRLWMTHYFKSLNAGTVFCPGGLAGMAWGPPAAITAKLLNPDKPVVSVSGDGGFAMASHVLSTAVQYKLPITFVVMNNSILGMIYDGQEEKPVATKFIDTDFSIIAQGFGARGVRIRKPEEMTPAIKEALKADLPTVIDVITDQTESHTKIASEGAH
jgi:acetolactate synthase-1/2/3 large subunit